MKTYIPRLINLKDDLKSKSLFLLGPRQVGKSFLIKHTLVDTINYSLFDNETYLKFNRSPRRLREEVLNKTKVVVIDEIQKLPLLLDEVHLLIEDCGINFLLTGSSARKLRRGGVNLLGGRARIKNMHPFICRELKEEFNIEKALNNGLIPSVYFSDKPNDDLESYVSVYLKEEIANEAIVRNIPAFSRFLEIAALSNGKILNYTNISNDAQVPKTTIYEYFQILKDTLIGYEVPAWNKTIKRKAINTSKFYFFDTGVCKYLQNRRRINKGSPEFGEFFESYIFHEIKTYLDYKTKETLSYWRSTSGFEVDFIISDHTAIEVKSSKNITRSDLKGLMTLSEENKLKNYVLICFEERERVVDGIRILPWEVFLDLLWNGSFDEK